MNDRQRMKIKEMRRKGIGYKAIAAEVELSRDSVRHYCQRNNLAGYGKCIAAMEKGRTQ